MPNFKVDQLPNLYMNTPPNKVLSNEGFAALKFDHTFRLNSLMDSFKGMAYCSLYDEFWTMVFVSQGSERLTGYLPEELIGNKVISYENITYEEDRERVRNEIELSLSTKVEFEVEYRIRRADGIVEWVLECGKPVYNGNEELVALEGYVQSINKRKSYEHSLLEAEFQYRSIFENSIIGIFQTTPNGKYLIVNSALARMYGYPSPYDLMHALNNIQQQLYVLPIQRQKFIDAMTTHGSVSNFESQVYKKDGNVIWISENARMVHDAKGEFLYYEGTVQDVTEQRLVKEALQLSEHSALQSLKELEHQKYVLDMHSIVSITNVDGLITHVNDKFCQISGYSRNELIGKNHEILNSGHHPKGYFKEMYLNLMSGEPWSGEVCNRAKNDNLYWVESTVVPFMGVDEKPQSYISIGTNITKSKEAEVNSYYLAFYDYLTNLPNRRLFTDRLNQAVIANKRTKRNSALLFLDLDNFKIINDTQGHDVGDILLQQVSGRLSECVREGDTVARIGGDEFVLLLENLCENTLEAAAQVELIGEKIISALNEPYQIGLNKCYSTSSIGVVMFGNQGEAEVDLLKNADIAMYQAKKAGRNRLSFFDPNMQDVINRRVDLERELLTALETRQFKLHYQVQVNQNGHALGAEALIRWIHPQQGLISPMHFIPLAEETGHIYAIGQWVLDMACQQLKSWQASTLTKKLVLSVNVSAKQFWQTDFVTKVQQTILRHNINPALLKLELTESLLVEDIKNVIATMNALQETGIKLSLDDFGTGYSSLQYLKALPLNQLKIDQSFVRDIATGYRDRAIVLTIITMANSLGLEVIAEGVETSEQRDFLYNNGCSMYQGYFFSKPLEIGALENLLQQIGTVS